MSTPSSTARHGLPFVSVVIPTRDRAAMLRTCLRSLQNQNYPRALFEIVVVDDGSSDETPAAVAAAALCAEPRVRYVRLDAAGVNAARNVGVGASKGDPICFVDDDTEAPPNWLLSLIQGTQRHPQAGGFGGRVLDRYEGFKVVTCGREADSFAPRADEGPVTTVVGCNMACRRRALEKTGGFASELSGWGDELELHQRMRCLDLEVVFIPHAFLWHRRSGNRRTTLRAYYRRGQERTRYRLRYGLPAGQAGGTTVLQFFRYAGHAALRRCHWGLFAAAGALGELTEEVRQRRRSQTRHSPVEWFTPIKR